ncbi:MAG TPA: protein-disulfide reductase DsbD domain-containing protein [Pyrinomonadaceae bacterium]|nr:protein-disulfide reductase DsbD domain-containing protein [Pyrinomonadaceae bacterium]
MTALFRLTLLTTLLLLPVSLYSTPVPQTAADVQVSGAIKPDKVKKSSTTRGLVVLDIPASLHVQSNKPADKYLVPTKLELEAPDGIKIGPVTYPRAIVRKLKFSKTALTVYEGRALFRFNVTVPANYSGSSGEIRGKIRFQACNEDACFPPLTREVKMLLNVE